MQILDIFLENTPGKVKQLAAALTAKNCEQAAELAHSIKGSAGSLGAMRLHCLCQFIESSARQDGLGRIGGLERLMDAELSALIVALNEVKARAS